MRPVKRSKWDQKKLSSTVGIPPGGPPNAAAEAAAARLNAKLAAEGKLVTTAQPIPVPVKKLAPLQFTAEVIINDIVGRAVLTRSATQQEIMRSTGAFVSVKGRYMSDDEKAIAGNGGDRPLYLFVCADTQAQKDSALEQIGKVILSSESSLPVNLQTFTYNPSLFEKIGIPLSVCVSPFLHDKVFVKALESKPGIATHLFGPQGSFLKHIAAETGAKVILQGIGSGHVDLSSGRESFEPLHFSISHTTRDGLLNARKLCEDLINTVQKDLEIHASQGQGFYQPDYPPIVGLQPLMSLQFPEALPQAGRRGPLLPNPVDLGLVPPLQYIQQFEPGAFPGPVPYPPPPPPLPPPSGLGHPILPPYVDPLQPPVQMPYQEPLVGPQPPPLQYAESGVCFETPYGNPQFRDAKSEPEKSMQKAPRRKFTEEDPGDTLPQTYIKKTPTFSSPSDSSFNKFKVPQLPARKRSTFASENEQYSGKGKVARQEKKSAGLASLAAYEDSDEDEDG